MSSATLPTPLLTQITSVVVYVEAALIHRRGTVVLPAGATVLEVPGLPATVQPQSLRVTSSGESPVQIWEARLLPAQAADPNVALVQTLSDQLQELEARQRAIKDAMVTLRLQLEMVAKLSTTAIAALSRQITLPTTEPARVEFTPVEAWLEFVGTRHRAYADQLAALESAEKEIAQAIHARQQQRHDAQTRTLVKGYRVSIRVEAAIAGEVELDLSYLITEAGWTPHYDCYIDLAQPQLELIYLADITQNTDETWTDVEVILSTEKPGISIDPPELVPWIIGSPRANQQRVIRAAGRGTDAPGLGGYDQVLGAAPGSELPANIQRRQASAATGNIQRHQDTVTFSIARPTTIPSQGQPHRLVILQEVYPCQLKHVALPRQVSFAYLQAEFTRPSDRATLLPGSINLFQGHTFMGTTQLPAIAAGQPISLNLGIDHQLKIERHLVEHSVDQRLLGNQRRIIIGYTLEITNRHPQAVNLIVTEQLPTSPDETITVRLLTTTPKIEVQELNQLQWHLTLPSQSPRSLHYQFMVEHPPDVEVVGLNLA